MPTCRSAAYNPPACSIPVAPRPPSARHAGGCDTPWFRADGHLGRGFALRRQAGRQAGIRRRAIFPEQPKVGSSVSKQDEGVRNGDSDPPDEGAGVCTGTAEPSGDWLAAAAERLEKLLPKKEDPMCDGDMCDVDWKGSGTILGAALLIAGSALGGGMLAVPAATSAAGFFPALVCMVGVWLFLLLEGLLLVEVNLAVASWLQRRSASMLALARITLGNSFGTLVAGAYLLFSYATLISQIIRGGSMMTEMLPAVPYMGGVVAVAALGGSLIYFSTSSGIDRINKALTIVLMASFALLVTFSLRSAMWAQLAFAQWPEVMHSAPTLLQVLSYCNLIPVVCTYLDMDRERIIKAVILGSSIPLLMVGTWTAMSTALVPYVAGSGPTDPISVLLQGGSGGVVSFLVTIFAGSAVFTTIIGVLLSLHEFWQEAFRGKAADMQSSVEEFEAEEEQRPWWDRYGARELKTRMVALTPALLVATLAPTKAFYDVLSFSGSYLVTFLFGIAPPLMALVIRGQGGIPGSKWDGPASEPILPGGMALLGALFFCTVAFMGLFLSADLPELQDWFSHHRWGV